MASSYNIGTEGRMTQFFINLDVESDVRFDPERFMQYTDNLDPLTSSIFTDVKKLNIAGYFVIGGEEYRPDSISFKIYGHHQYWWLLMAYNDIQDINALTSGRSIKYPSQADLEDIYFSLKSRSTGQGT
jgi:hypothetical protein